jgi:hypothetical protein
MTNEQFTLHQNFNLKEFARLQGVDYSTMRKIKQLYFKDKTIYYIAKRFNLTKYEAGKIKDKLFHIDAKRNSIIFVNKKAIQYYQTEDEMLIQDYKAEDLTGDEKLIFEKL